MAHKYLFKDRAEAEEAFRGAQNTASLLDLALHLVMNTAPDWTGRCGAFSAKLYRATSAHGGVLVLTERIRDSSPHTSAEYFEETLRRYRDRVPYEERHMPVRHLLEQANMARHNLCEALQGKAVEA